MKLTSNKIAENCIIIECEAGKEICSILFDTPELDDDIGFGIDEAEEYAELFCKSAGFKEALMEIKENIINDGFFLTNKNRILEIINKTFNDDN